MARRDLTAPLLGESEPESVPAPLQVPLIHVQPDPVPPAPPSPPVSTLDALIDWTGTYQFDILYFVLWLVCLVLTTLPIVHLATIRRYNIQIGLVLFIIWLVTHRVSFHVQRYFNRVMTRDYQLNFQRLLASRHALDFTDLLARRSASALRPLSMGVAAPNPPHLQNVAVDKQAQAQQELDEGQVEEQQVQEQEADEGGAVPPPHKQQQTVGDTEEEDWEEKEEKEEKEGEGDEGGGVVPEPIDEPPNSNAPVQPLDRLSARPPNSSSPAAAPPVEKNNKSAAEEMWFLCFPLRLKLLLIAIVPVVQLCSSSWSHEAGTVGVELMVPRLLSISNLRFDTQWLTFETCYWVALCVLLLLLMATLAALLLPLYLGQKWIISFGRLFILALKEAQFDPSRRIYAFDWCFGHFLDLLTWILDRCEAGYRQDHEWTLSLVEYLVTIWSLAYLPLNTYLVRSISCSQTGELYADPSVACWLTHRHARMAFASMIVFGFSYFAGAFIHCWAQPMLLLDEHFARQQGRFGLRSQALVFDSPIYAARYISCTFGLLMLKIFFLSVYPRLVEWMVCVANGLLLLVHGLPRRADVFWPSTVASLNRWRGWCWTFALYLSLLSAISLTLELAFNEWTLDGLILAGMLLLIVGWWRQQNLALADR